MSSPDDAAKAAVGHCLSTASRVLIRRTVWHFQDAYCRPDFRQRQHVEVVQYYTGPSMSCGSCLGTR